jgi:hypothetical protein
MQELEPDRLVSDTIRVNNLHVSQEWVKSKCLFCDMMKRIFEDHSLNTNIRTRLKLNSANRKRSMIYVHVNVNL